MTTQTEFDRDPATFNEAIETPDIYSQIDAANGWEDRGNPQIGFDEAADEMASFFLWMLTGSNRGANSTYKNLRDRDIMRSLKDPAIMGRRMIAVIYTLHPDLINAMTLTSLAQKCGTTPQNLSNYISAFFSNFPVFKNRIRHGRQWKKAKEQSDFKKNGL